MAFVAMGFCDFQLAVLRCDDPDGPGEAEGDPAGGAGSMQINQNFLLVAAVLMEIPMAMIILSRVLNYRANRLANLFAAAIMTAVQVSSLFVGKGPTVYYAFFSAVEIACTVFIFWTAWKWLKPKGD
jgi:hypothetical protein